MTEGETVLLAVVMLLLLTACGLNVVQGSGNIQTEARPVSGFDSVTFSGSGEMVITQGDSESPTVTSEKSGSGSLTSLGIK